MVKKGVNLPPLNHLSYFQLEITNCDLQFLYRFATQLEVAIFDFKLDYSPIGRALNKRNYNPNSAPSAVCTQENMFY
ncbi:hypothetical protein DBR11_27260 [Pedobacter sp. HMWF019]|nr:hypothetical protein DBR11_27260 [Pedobacter sp. HMWF019]